MAKSVAFLQVVALGIICMVVNTPEGEAVLTCNEVKEDLCPCLSYIAGGGVLTRDCCNGWMDLVNAAGQTKADSQTACSCLKVMIDYFKDEELRRAAVIHTPCGVNLSFNLSRNMDCSKVKILIGW